MGKTLTPLTFKKGAVPPTPISGDVVFYAANGGALMSKDDAGVVRTIGPQSLAQTATTTASTAAITASNQKITNLADPTLGTDAANRAFVLAQVTSMAPVGQELGYAERFTSFSTTNVTVWSVAAASVIGSLSVAVTGTGRPVDVEFYCPLMSHSVSTSTVTTYLIVNGVTNNGSSTYKGWAAPQLEGGIMKRRLVLVSGTSYTFTVGMSGAVAGTATANAQTGGPLSLAVTQR